MRSVVENEDGKSRMHDVSHHQRDPEHVRRLALWVFCGTTSRLDMDECLLKGEVNYVHGPFCEDVHR